MVLAHISTTARVEHFARCLKIIKFYFGVYSVIKLDCGLYKHNKI